MNPTNLLLLGVGGQGILFASNVLVRLAEGLGLDVTTSEIHGMAQRGGAVESHVRIGEKVLSPLIRKGTADIVIALENGEPLRYLDYPKQEALILLSDARAIPPSVTTGLETYPSSDDIQRQLAVYFEEIHLVGVTRIQRRLGHRRIGNAVMLGAVSAFLPYEVGAWQEALKSVVSSRFHPVNLEAFNAGRREMERLPSRRSVGTF